MTVLLLEVGLVQVLVQVHSQLGLLERQPQLVRQHPVLLPVVLLAKVMVEQAE